MTEEMKVEVKEVIPFFYRIFNNYTYKEYRNVLLSKQNFVLLGEDWYPIEDLEWLLSDHELNNPVDVFVAKADNLCTENYYVIYTDIVGVSEPKIPYCKYTDLDIAINSARKLKLDEEYEYVAVINDRDEEVYRY